jgi:hypothetical protein
MNAIHSPTQTANKPLHLQRQLSAVGLVSPRSSVSGEDSLDRPASQFSNTGIGRIAGSENSLNGRLRSGSFGCPASAPVSMIFLVQSVIIRAILFNHLDIVLFLACISQLSKHHWRCPLQHPALPFHSL